MKLTVEINLVFRIIIDCLFCLLQVLIFSQSIYLAFDYILCCLAAMLEV